MPDGPPPPPPTELLLVCGLARSGTSLVGALLNSTGAVEIFNEVPSPLRFPSLAGVLEDYRRWAGEIAADPVEAWRGIDAAAVTERSFELFRAFCRAVRPVVPPDSERWDRPVAGEPRTMCLKVPYGELDIGWYDRQLGSERSRFVYCTRSPADTYESLLSMPWGCEMPPAEFHSLLSSSLRAVAAVLERQPRRVFVFDVERTSGSPPERERVAAALLRWLGTEPGPAVADFVQSWRPVNRRPRGPELIPASERRSRLDRLEALLAADPELVRLLARVRLHRPPESPEPRVR